MEYLFNSRDEVQRLTSTVTPVSPLDLPVIQGRLGASSSEVSVLCQKWHITELCLFGSVLRDDFGSSSDIDLLASFDTSFHRGLSETLQIRDDFAYLFKRPVDLVVREAIEHSSNWIRREEILETARLLYVAR